MFPFGFQVLQQSHDSTSSILSLSVSQQGGFPLPNGPIGCVGIAYHGLSWHIFIWSFQNLVKSVQGMYMAYVLSSSCRSALERFSGS